jgi:hypothetical protein
MPKFTSLDDLAKYIQQQANEITEKELVPKVKEVQIEKIRTVVYKAYEPKQYQRRYGDQGLEDIGNIRARSIYDGKYFVITNETMRKGQKGYLAPLIEFGHYNSIAEGYGGYNYPIDNRFLPYMKPRPFIKETVRELEENELHYKIMRDSLRKRGLDTK